MLGSTNVMDVMTEYCPGLYPQTRQSLQNFKIDISQTNATGVIIIRTTTQKNSTIHL